MKIKILTLIKKILNGWEPSDIFYSYKNVYDNVTDMDGIVHYTYTVLGQWIEDNAYIFSVLKIFYYIPSILIYISCNFLWIVITLFLSPATKKILYKNQI